MTAAFGALLGQAQQTFEVPANVTFAVLAVFMVAAAIRVVTTKNVVHAALWLLVVLGGNGLVYLLLQAEFVAMTQFLVYLGAIVVLFLFGIMLTRAPLGRSDDLDTKKQRPLGFIVAAVLLVVVAGSLIVSYDDCPTGDGAGTEQCRLTFVAYEGASVGAEAARAGRTGAVSDSIFSGYLVPFEVLSVLLLAALIGAIVIARKD